MDTMQKAIEHAINEKVESIRLDIASGMSKETAIALEKAESVLGPASWAVVLERL
jgi:hypothetical protein